MDTHVHLLLTRSCPSNDTSGTTLQSVLKLKYPADRWSAEVTIRREIIDLFKLQRRISRRSIRMNPAGHGVG
ncbi:putative DNA ligase [Trichinella spiralis]|uniref:DNA ligase n=1 Tax=Trichinella spiralis TaxID=6334 RepID=A0ABR3KAA0_TRISP